MKTPEIVLSRTNAIDQIDLLINNIRDLIAYKRDFEAFIILSIGIELLGSFYDAEDISDYGNSETRFNNCLKNDFKNQWYTTHAKWVFQNLRGPLIHQYRPGPEILLTSACKNGVKKDTHLTKHGEKTIFVLEQLFDDYQEAFSRFKNKLNKANSLNKDKPVAAHQDIMNINNEEEPIIVSASTVSNKRITSKEKKRK